MLSTEWKGEWHLSREIAGLHLDDNGKTAVDDKLEKKNFQHAGEILAEIWNKVVVDGCPTVEYKIQKSNLVIYSKRMRPGSVHMCEQANILPR